ncbi:Gfo/Idh/MocA family protein [Lacipirellula limnantheis]|uniref:Glucose--fructose oxidoreductase n=1 Tax=Lacipirellula limnantheis TaxID=2528024 RepID=A0A517U0J7_9BACT|nr:Gfo/Idh/MocA family oxidoreductase [Lacipirellula limnantheis]QDT74149.1 Glucose--fructose oxidoreductase precursor [Lacipirellula limnantheis]
MSTAEVNRRQFLEQATAVSAAAVASAATVSASCAAAAADAPRRIRVGVIGCGSVSGRYLPHLSECTYAEVVSVCDIIPERAGARAKEFRVPHEYPHIDAMLSGVPFDLLVNLTDMQEHERLNRQAIEAGKHIWSEKPIANSLAAGQELLRLAKGKGVRVWGAPVVVASPQFSAMARAIAAGELGAIASAKADYGHTGPDWSAFFYKEGGGSLPDLGVYNLSTLTGLLGPAKSVTAMTSIVTPTRNIYEKGKIKVEAEDNALVLLDHGDAKISCVQCGFNFFNPHGHEGKSESRHTVSIYGSRGSMGLVGYDWEPLGVDVATEARPEYERRATDAKGYVWQQGASEVAECLATGKEPLFTAEHALHVVEIMTAARESQREGRRIPLTSTFKWPVVT